MTDDRESIAQLARHLTTPLDAALAYAASGWVVLAVSAPASSKSGPRDQSAGKRPLTRRGVYDASDDPERIRRWWRRWPGANVGIATGTRSALAVVDVDLHRGGEGSLGALRHAGLVLPVTFLVRTGGGGFHLLYRQPAGVTVANTVGRLPGVAEPLPGIDLRGDGGYVVAPPSLHVSGRRYTWARHQPSDMADLPTWLWQPPPPPPHTLVPDQRPRHPGAYGSAALAREVEVVRRLVPGQRNDGLNRSAFSLGSLVAGGELAEDVVARELVAAAVRVGLGTREACRTVRSGLRAGARSPRTRGDRQP